MKKIKGLVIVLLATIVLTGCGSTETLTCSMTEDSSGLNMKQEIDIDFKKNEASKVKVSVVAEATDTTIQENWDIFASTLDSQYNTSEKKDGLTITTDNDKDNYKYTISIEVDFAKASDDVLEEYGLDDVIGKKTTKKEVKEAAENSGYTCK